MNNRSLRDKNRGRKRKIGYNTPVSSLNAMMRRGDKAVTKSQLGSGQLSVSAPPSHAPSPLRCHQDSPTIPFHTTFDSSRNSFLKALLVHFLLPA